MGVTIDDLVEVAMKPEEGTEWDDAQLLELARCVEVNLDNIKPIAEANPIFGLAWSQALALAKVIIKREED